MNRFHVVVTTIVAAASLGFTLRTLGHHEVPEVSGPAADPTPYTQESEQVPHSEPAEIPPTF